MLSLTGISKTYPGGVHALQYIHLDVPRGMFGLLGPNGAGKSSLMRTIATLQQPDCGSITFNGIDILRDKTALRRTLGYLPQEFGAYPRTSALAMLIHLAALKGIHGRQQQQVVENLLVKTNLWDARNKSVDKFSGGMKQRYGIAQALLGNPALLIVDEPTAGLDPAERRRFLNILAEVGEETVVILSTHIVDDVEELCARVAIMGRGRILKVGEPLQMIREMNGKLWTQVVKREEVAEIRARHTALSTLLSGRLKAGSIEIRALSDAQPEGMQPAAPELEDVYFSTLIEHNLKDNLE
jgi:ABC-type multidrug transport system ATPase subunit